MRFSCVILYAICMYVPASSTVDHCMLCAMTSIIQECAVQLRPTMPLSVSCASDVERLSPSPMDLNLILDFHTTPFVCEMTTTRRNPLTYKSLPDKAALFRDATKLILKQLTAGYGV
ncbi:hypothetical protein C8Q77DRAFT_539524 [Trametes polyzona]|nr:hypothetical protein C8Q77DRAFT_539524 [Trametes polyzona]